MNVRLTITNKKCAQRAYIPHPICSHHYNLLRKYAYFQTRTKVRHTCAKIMQCVLISMSFGQAVCERNNGGDGIYGICVARIILITSATGLRSPRCTGFRSPECVRCWLCFHCKRGLFFNTLRRHWLVFDFFIAKGRQIMDVIIIRYCKSTLVHEMHEPGFI